MRRGYLIAAVFTRRCFEWQRRHRRLTVAFLSFMLFAGLVPYLVFAVTFTRDTSFIGNVGIGATPAAGNKLDITTPSGTAVNFHMLQSGVLEGNIGIPANSQNWYFNTQGTLGSGGVYLSNGATTWTSNSDRRLKTNITTLTSAQWLAAIEQLNPVTFNWRDPSSATTTQIGLIAQDVQKVFPEIITVGATTTFTPDGALGIQYTGLIAPLVKAVQEIANLSDAFKNTLIAWLADASNGIHDLYATVVHATTGHFSNELCVGDTCVTPEQFQAMVAAANQSGTGGSTSPTSNVPSNSPQAASTTPDTTPPTITINGENLAHITVGDSYADLGASVTDNVDQNLGVKTFLNGALVSDIIIDTSAEATDTIDYVATDAAGNTATSTRTVTIEPTSADTSAGSNKTADQVTTILQ